MIHNALHAYYGRFALGIDVSRKYMPTNVQWCVPVQWLHVKAWRFRGTWQRRQMSKGFPRTYCTRAPCPNPHELDGIRQLWAAIFVAKKTLKARPGITLPIATSAQACQAHCACLAHPYIRNSVASTFNFLSPFHHSFLPPFCHMSTGN